MTDKLRSVMAYILKIYPKNMSEEMSNARLTKMVYLVDWKNTLNTGHQVTGIKWYFDNYGPFVNDVENTAKSNSDVFLIDFGSNMYGQPKKTFKLKHDDISFNLSLNEIASITSIVNETKKLYWREFIKLVYSTYPVASSDRYNYLDLESKAKKYKSIKEQRQRDIQNLAF